MCMLDYVVLIIMFGGMVVLGINGFVVGFMVVVMFIVVWYIYIKVIC